MSGSNNQYRVKGLLVLYFTFVLAIVATIFFFPKIYNWLDDQRIDTLDARVSDILSQGEDTATFDQLTLGKGVELFIQMEDGVVYSSLPSNQLSEIRQFVKQQNLAYESASTKEINGKEYLIWLAVYPQNAQKRYEVLVIMIGLLLMAAFAVLLLLFMKMRNHLMKPLQRLKDSILHLKDFEFDAAIQTTKFHESGGVLQDLERFSVDMKENIEQIGSQYTALELSLTKEQLEQSYKNSLFASLIHDLKTPLSIMILTVEQLEEEPQSPKTEQKLVQLAQLQEKLMDEINGLVKIANTKFEVESNEVEIVELVRQSLKRFKSIILHKQLYSEITVPQKLVVDLSPIEAEQLLHNIFSNITNYTRPQGFFSVSIELVGNQLQIETFNEISPEQEIDFDHAFDLFYSSREEGKGYGTGTGMFIIRSIIDNHQGQTKFFPVDNGVKMQLNMVVKVKEVSS